MRAGILSGLALLAEPALASFKLTRSFLGQTNRRRSATNTERDPQSDGVEVAEFLDHAERPRQRGSLPAVPYFTGIIRCS